MNEAEAAAASATQASDILCEPHAATLGAAPEHADEASRDVSEPCTASEAEAPAAQPVGEAHAATPPVQDGAAPSGEDDCGPPTSSGSGSRTLRPGVEVSNTEDAERTVVRRVSLNFCGVPLVHGARAAPRALLRAADPPQCRDPPHRGRVWLVGGACADACIVRARVAQRHRRGPAWPVA